VKREGCYFRDRAEAGERLAGQLEEYANRADVHDLEPPERKRLWETGEAPETFPSGI